MLYSVVVRLTGCPPRSPHGGAVECQAARVITGASTRGPALESADPSQQLGEVEGLDQIVVGAGVESLTRSGGVSRAVSIRIAVGRSLRRAQRTTSMPAPPASASR